MTQIQHYDKRVGITYVYESESYYDPEKKQSRSKRKLIGKIDPDTGEMIPTGRRGRPSKNITSDEAGSDYRKLYSDARKNLVKAEAKIKTLQSELEKEKQTVAGYKKRIREISGLCAREIG